MKDSLYPIFVPSSTATGYSAGYIDAGGRIAISPKFDGAFRFHEERACVRIGSHFAAIDRSGRIVVNPIAETYFSYSSGFAAFRRGSLFGLVDRSGHEVLSPRYRFLGEFSHGFAEFAASDNRRGFLNLALEEEIAAVFEDTRPFGEGGFAPVRVNGCWGYIDSRGKMVIEPMFLGALPFSGQLGRVKTEDGFGFVDLAGNLKIPPRYPKAFDFSESRAVVMIHGKYGFIDCAGEIVIVPQYSAADSFRCGRASFRTEAPERLVGFLHPDGNVAIEPQFIETSDFFDNLCLVSTETSLAYIDVDGRTVWSGPNVEYPVTLAR